MKNEEREKAWPSSSFFILNSSFFISLLVILIALPALAVPPVLDVRAGPGMEGIAAGIRNGDPHRFDAIMKLVGIDDPGPTILVLVAPESSDLAKKAPSWVSGYAVPQEHFIVLFPARATTYPIDGMEELLRHEVAHVIIDRAAGGAELPRWFSEGLATVAGDSWSMGDRGRFTLAIARGDEISLKRVEEMFGEDAGAIGRAYAISGDFVYEMLHRQGKDSAAKILAHVRRGAPFQEAVVMATGRSLYGIESDFVRRATIWNRWIPWLTSSVFLWALITLLAIWAMSARAKRDRAILADMDAATGFPEDDEDRSDDELVN